MKNWPFLFILFCVLLHSCKTVDVVQADVADNSIAELHIQSLALAEKVVLKKEGVTEFHYWELDDTPALWANNLGEVEEINRYSDSLQLVLGKDGFQQCIAKERTQRMPKSVLPGIENGDRINALLVHTGTLGHIRDINFLEAQILNYQLTRYPLFSRPTEFHGFIAAHEKERKIRVYFAASDQMWPPRPNVLIEHLEQEIQHGWRLKYHLHNHYCSAADNYVGILAPSLADAQYFKMLAERFNVSKALITNGFHTVEIDNHQFISFKSY